MNLEIWLPKLIEDTLVTLYMVGVSAFFTVILGLPLGVVLVTSDKKGLRPLPLLNQTLGILVNIGRSLPFIILLILIIPFTRALVGTTIGPTAAIVPLTLAAVPFFARVVESGIREVDHGLVDAAKAMGCTNWQIVSKVLIPEAKSSLILGVALTIISLVSYSAMAGVIGGGGLGDLAIRYGYQRREDTVMFATVILLIVIVQGVQLLGSWLAAKASKR
ncbi:MAG: methionine ABC transporter permease [Anaerolineaceae bacterium]|jgi:D-methionine transport system permease protein